MCRRTRLAAIAQDVPTVILYESPHRVSKLLVEISETLGPGTRVVIVREATKRHEEVIRGTAGELAAQCAEKTWKGEITVAIHQADD